MAWRPGEAPRCIRRSRCRSEEMDGGQGEGPGRQRGKEEQRDLSPSRGLNSAGIGPQDKV